MEGRIIKLISGVYTVSSEQGFLECKAKGSFRKTGFSPLVGDWVSVSLRSEGYHCIEQVAPRKNALCRPPMANLDQLFLVASATQPIPNCLTIDRMIAAAEDKEIEPILVLTKTDLASFDELERIYTNAGIPVIVCHTENDDGIFQIRKRLAGKISAFAGNTGVGKSTLLNRIAPQLQLPTGEISRKLGRGRHTTRHVELYSCADGYLADTPGFSSFDTVGWERICKENLQFAFREIRPLIGECQFTGCSHIKEKGCAVLAALERGEIEESRMNSYRIMYEEVKDLKDWQLEK